MLRDGRCKEFVCLCMCAVWVCVWRGGRGGASYQLRGWPEPCMLRCLQNVRLKLLLLSSCRACYLFVRAIVQAHAARLRASGKRMSYHIAIMCSIACAVQALNCPGSTVHDPACLATAAVQHGRRPGICHACRRRETTSKSLHARRHRHPSLLFPSFCNAQASAPHASRRHGALRMSLRQVHHLEGWWLGGASQQLGHAQPSGPHVYDIVSRRGSQHAIESSRCGLRAGSVKGCCPK